MVACWPPHSPLPCSGTELERNKAKAKAFRKHPHCIAELSILMNGNEGQTRLFRATQPRPPNPEKIESDPIYLLVLHPLVPCCQQPKPTRSRGATPAPVSSSRTGAPPRRAGRN